MPQNKPGPDVALPGLTLTGEAATQRLAEDMAMVAQLGWTLRLEGDLGAGKTTFARAFIRALAKDETLEVPSPTYTLVQRYDEADPLVLHADLYRLSDPSEMVELGLDDPDEPAIQLVEWPGNAGEAAFVGALTLTFAMAGAEARTVTISGPDHLLEKVRYSQDLRAFLADAGHGNATRTRLAGDASTRRYERIAADKPLILMDAPRQPDGPAVRDGKPYSQLVHLAESVHAFAAVGQALKTQGFAAPALHAADLDKGLLLIEDLGGATILHSDGTPDPLRYEAAVLLLADLHTKAWPQGLPIPHAGPQNSIHQLHRYDRAVFATEIELCPQWYAVHRSDARPYSLPDSTDAFDHSGFCRAWDKALVTLDDAPVTLTLRDYHSPNLIWRDDQAGTNRLGIIDHQDALLGPPAYDVASLVQDARVTISPALQADLLRAYTSARQAHDPRFDVEAFDRAFHLMAGQRNTKILGIFARLNDRDGKPGYLKHLPRIEAYMRQLLVHPVFAELKPFYDQLLPPRSSEPAS